ncbi:1952_t:CDS:1, partial [Dentiscutata erythropus]
MLGYCYDIGDGISQNYNEALKWYTSSANNGNYLAHNNLGNHYEQ